MTSPKPDTSSKPLPDMEMVARAWHALGDEPLDAIPFDGDGCNCRNYAPYARRVLELFYGEPVPEPDGLGAVVVNPLTGKVYVRDAHPALPWHNPGDDAPEQWSDPTCEDWFVWDDLLRPLVVHERGWTPPSPTSTPVVQSQPAEPTETYEPTGIGALVVDTANAVWVRVHNGREPWLKVDQTGTGIAENWEGPFYATDWAHLDHPVNVHSNGWQPPEVASS